MNTGKSAGLNVVLDTNVFVSAFVHRGVTFRLWQHAVEGRYRLLTSQTIILETARVLRAKFGWSDKVADIVVPKITLREVADDPDDDRILECALAGHADLIVSGDQHLLRLKSFRGIAVVTPTDFGRMLGAIIPRGRSSSSRSSADTRRF